VMDVVEFVRCMLLGLCFVVVIGLCIDLVFVFVLDGV